MKALTHSSFFFFEFEKRDGCRLIGFALAIYNDQVFPHSEMVSDLLIDQYMGLV